MRTTSDGGGAGSDFMSDQRSPEPIYARAYLAAIVDSSDDAIISKDLNGIIQSCNAAAERMFGYTADELVGHPVRMLIPPERQSEEDDILTAIRHGERVDHFETVRITKTGERLDISLTVSPVRDSSGNIVGVSKVAREITGQKRAAAELAAQRRALEAALSERDRLLAAERHARAEAERANRMKDDFVAIVSHELRTPLNAILGWTHLMMRGRRDQETLDRGLEIVARNTRMQAQLISDLLDISRIVSGKLRLEVEPVDLRSIIADAAAAVQDEARAKDIDVRLDLAESTPPVSGDPARLQQVVWNLLSNAIKFSSQGGRVTVTLRRRESMVQIAVADQGVGIRPDFLPHVFERFHQADRSITRRYGGLGLGLSIVKDLISLHGGTVRAESPGEGRGATFTVNVPPASVHAPKASVAPDEPETGRSDAVSLERLRVLVVEDEPDTQEFLSRLLESHGAAVTRAGSAAEALSRFRDNRPDILISDIGLPETDGYQLMQQIRDVSGAGSAGVPAIALTAYARAEDRTRALRAGYQVHIAKPVESSELVATVASLADLIEARRRAR
jgi:PAS domain S-box-containing protein